MGNKKIAGIIAALGLLSIACPARADWLQDFQRSIYGDYSTAVDCYEGTVSDSVCEGLDRRVNRGTRINAGAAASQGIRNGVQQSNYNAIYRQRYHDALNQADYFCGIGHGACSYWLQQVQLYERY